MGQVEQIDEGGNTTIAVHFIYMRSVGEVMPTFMRGAVVVEPESTDNPMWRIACMPNMREFHQTPHHPNYQRTSDPRAVSCLTCQDTEEYKTAIGPYKNEKGQKKS